MTRECASGIVNTLEGVMAIAAILLETGVVETQWLLHVYMAASPEGVGGKEETRHQPTQQADLISPVSRLPSPVQKLLRYLGHYNDLFPYDVLLTRGLKPPCPIPFACPFDFL